MASIPMPPQRLLLCGDKNWNSIWIIKHYLERVKMSVELDCVVIADFGNIDLYVKQIAEELNIRLIERSDFSNALFPEPNYIIMFHNDSKDGHFENDDDCENVLAMAKSHNIPCVLIYDRINHMVKVMLYEKEIAKEGEKT